MHYVRDLQQYHNSELCLFDCLSLNYLLTVEIPVVPLLESTTDTSAHIDIPLCSYVIYLDSPRYRD